MNDTSLSWHRLLHASGLGGLLWGLTVAAVGLATPGSAESTDIGDNADYVICCTPSATPDGRHAPTASTADNDLMFVLPD